MRKQSEAQTDEQGEITRTAHLDRQKSNGIYRYRKTSIRRMGQWIHQCLVCHSRPHVFRLFFDTPDVFAFVNMCSWLMVDSVLNCLHSGMSSNFGQCAANS